MTPLGETAGHSAAITGNGMEKNYANAAAKSWVRPVAHRGLTGDFAKKLRGPVRFACVIASTDTAEIEGISAAGQTPYLRRFTAALDSEYLLFGKTLTLDDVPRNPLGPPSPVVISRAALTMMGITPLIVDAGTRVPPKTPRLVLGGSPGRTITTGKSLDMPEDYRLALSAAADLIAPPGGVTILAESVPGGTTTALSLLSALGIDAFGKVSSSMPGGNHGLKEKVVREALANAGLGPSPTALEAVTAVGDPMQLALSFIAMKASLNGPVILGGGTQMAAVLALMAKLAEEGEPLDPSNLALATTRWVANDPSSDLEGILNRITLAVPAFEASLDFSGCRHEGLRRYEEGLVKEGVGAGAAAFAALASGCATLETLTLRIDEIAEGLDAEK